MNNEITEELTEKVKILVGVVALYRTYEDSRFKDSPPEFNGKTLPDLTELFKSYDEIDQELTQIRNVIEESIKNEIP